MVFLDPRNSDLSALCRFPNVLEPLYRRSLRRKLGFLKLHYERHCAANIGHLVIENAVIVYPGDPRFLDRSRSRIVWKPVHQARRAGHQSKKLKLSIDAHVSLLSA